MDLSIISMRLALTDWLNLLQGPSDPPFTENADFQSPWKYLFRLITLVMIMITSVLTFSYLGLSTSEQEGILQAFVKNTVAQARYTIMIILGGALFAVLYALIVAPVFKVKISVPQAFFAFLFILLPWIPIIALVWVLGYILPDLPLLPFFIPAFMFVLFPFLFVIKFSKAICFVSSSGKGRCLASIAIPVITIVGLMYWAIIRT